MRAFAWAILAVVSTCAVASAAERATVFNLKLGSSIAELPPISAFKAYACGSNGGPPGKPLTGWAEFKDCSPGDDGLHEVYFEYDDTAERTARAKEDYAAGWFAGTAVDFFPIIASALFDDAGVLKAVRMVTDPRPEQRRDPFLHLRPRSEHYLLGLYLRDQFGLSASDCRDVAPPSGASPVLGMLVDQRCEATKNGVRVIIDSQFYRRPGEHDVDPATGQLTTGAYVSITRAEIRLLQ